MIELKHVKKAYPNVTPLEDVNAVINTGDVISVIGPSGTGKSTLLRMINLMEYPTSGEIYIDGECITNPKCDIDKVRMKIGMVFQSFNLFSHQTVVENIMMPQIDLLKRDHQAAYDKAIDLLQLVGLKDKAMNYPDELSGGQKQRVAIARTLAMDPEIILFDEPTSALDPNMVGEVTSVIKDLANTGHTIMIVTHEMNFAKSICNRVFYMDQGGIYEDGSREQIFENPKKELTKLFIQSFTTLRFEIDKNHFDFRKAVADIDTFARTHKFDSRLNYKVQFIFEEVLLHYLFKDTPAKKISFAMVYTPKTNTVDMRFMTAEACEYGPATDSLSVDMINAICNDLQFEDNTFKITVKGGAFNEK